MKESLQRREKNDPSENPSLSDERREETEGLSAPPDDDW